MRNVNNCSILKTMWATQIYETKTTASLQLGSRLGINYIRSQQEYISIKIGDVDEIMLNQTSMGLMAISGVVWDAGLLLVDYLVTETQDLNHSGLIRRSLDLGCGTGVVGLVAALLGAERVVLSDTLAAAPSLNENIEMLSCHVTTKNNASVSISFVSYDWRELDLPLEFKQMSDVEEVKEEREGEDKVGNKATAATKAVGGGNNDDDDGVWDSLLCSDVLYDHHAHAPLMRVLRGIRFRRLVLGFKRRHDDAELAFLTELASWCDIQIVVPEAIRLVNLNATAANAGLFIIIATPLNREELVVSSKDL